MSRIKANKNIIPASATLAESGYYVLQSIEEDYNELMRDMALTELGVLESTGEELVYEGAILTEATDKVGSFVDSNYGKIKGMYEKFLQDQQAKANKLNKGIPAAKAKKAVSANIGSIADKEYAKSYAYTNLETAKSGSDSNKIWAAVGYLASAASTVSEANVDEVKSKFASMIGASSPSVKDVKAAAISYLRGADKSFSITKSTVSSNLNEMWDCVFNFKKISSEVKGCLNKSKAAFTSLNKASKAGADDAVTKVRVKFQKYAAQVIAALNNAILLVYKEQLDTNRKVVWKVTSQCLKAAPVKKAEKKEAPVKEDAGFETEYEKAEFIRDILEANVANVEVNDRVLTSLAEAGVDITDIIPESAETERVSQLFDFDLDD